MPSPVLPEPRQAVSPSSPVVRRMFTAAGCSDLGLWSVDLEGKEKEKEREKEEEKERERDSMEVPVDHVWVL